MVELPRVPFNTSETRPIRYGLSQGDIAGPYTEIARAADKASGALSDVAEPLAEQAAAQSVRRDDSGNLIVDKLPPILGDAGKVARLTIAAKLQPQIETDLLRQKVDSPNDPVGFAKSVEAYRPQLMKGLDPQLAVGVGKMIDNTSQQYMRSLIVEKDAHDTSQFKESMEAQLTRNTDQRQVLSRQEGGPESPEYARLVKEHDSIINAMVANPKVGLNPDKAQLLKDEAHGNDIGQAAIGSTIRQFQTKKNKVEAQRFLYDWMWGDKGKDLPLTPRQREHFISEGLRSLEGMSAEDSKAITASKANINTLTTSWGKNPESFQQSVWDTARKAALAVGDSDGAHMLDAYHDLHPVFVQLGSQRSEDRDRQINLIRHLVRGTTPGAPPDEAFSNAPGAPVPIDLNDAATFKIWDRAVEIGRERASRDAQTSYDSIKESIDTGKVVTQGRVDQLQDLTILGHRGDLLEKLRPALSVLVGRGQMTREKSNEVYAETKAALTDHPDAQAQQMLAATEKQHAADIAELNANPLGYTINHYGGAPTAQLDASKPEEFTGVLAGRAPTMAKFHQMEKEFGGASWVAPEEGDQFASQLKNLPSKDAASAIRMLAQIPDTDGDRLATLTQKSVMGGIRDAGYSIDPGKMEASMLTQEELWQAHPHQYVAAYGDEAEKHLTAWQSMSAFTPEEKAARLNRPVPGRDQKARKEIETKAKTDMSSWSAEDVAYRMGDGLWGIGRLTGATPGVPASTIVRDAFLNEFKDGVATIVGSGEGDIGKAQQIMAQKMATEWKVSPVNNNTLTKYAPEVVYPVLPGDPEGHWLHEQLHEHIASLQGPEFNYGAGEQAAPNWKFEGLITDMQSKHEKDHGQAVSYRIGVIDGNGQHQVLKDADGGFSRFKFVPGKATDPTTPAGRAYEAKRIALEKSEKHLAARDAFQTRLYGFGSQSGAALKALPPIDIPNMVRGAIGAPPLEAQSPPYNHDAHVGARDGGE